MFSDAPPTRAERLACERTDRLARELAACAIDAEALARRIHACDGLRPSARQHAEKVAHAAIAVCDAAIAVAGITPELRMIFGQYVGARRRVAASLLDEVDER